MSEEKNTTPQEFFKKHKGDKVTYYDWRDGNGEAWLIIEEIDKDNNLCGPDENDLYYTLESELFLKNFGPAAYNEENWIVLESADKTIQDGRYLI